MVDASLELIPGLEFATIGFGLVLVNSDVASSPAQEQIRPKRKHDVFSFNFRFDTRASHSELEGYLVLAKSTRRPKDGFFLRAESFFNVATEVDRIGVIDSYGGKSLHEQSHGESFLALLMNRFGGKGLYLLDEPEAALSPQRQLAVLSRIHDLVSDDSQFVIATHSPILMAYPNATIYGFSQDGVRKIDYYETEHYQVTHDFLANPKRMLDILMEPSPDAPPPRQKRARG